MLVERKDRGAEDKPCLQETRKPNNDSSELQHESSPFRNLLHTRCVLYVLDNVFIVHLHNKSYTVHAPDCKCLSLKVSCSCGSGGHLYRQAQFESWLEIPCMQWGMEIASGECIDIKKEFRHRNAPVPD